MKGRLGPFKLYIRYIIVAMCSAFVQWPTSVSTEQILKARSCCTAYRSGPPEQYCYHVDPPMPESDSPDTEPAFALARSSLALCFAFGLDIGNPPFMMTSAWSSFIGIRLEVEPARLGEAVRFCVCEADWSPRPSAGLANPGAPLSPVLTTFAVCQLESEVDNGLLHARHRLKIA